jgi:hypothetical protein
MYMHVCICMYTCMRASVYVCTSVHVSVHICKNGEED